MADDVYRNSFGPEEIERQDREFEHGIGDDELTTIKTPGSKRSEHFLKFGNLQSNHVKIPLATFSFMASAMKKQKTKKNTSSKAGPKSSASRFDDPEYEPVLSNDDDDDGENDAEEKFTRCFNNAQKHSRNMRPRNNANEVEVASKEVVADGGVKPLTFVSLNEASKQQAQVTVKQMLQDDPAVCDTSCDELEEYVAKKDAEAKLRRRKERREYFSGNKGAAPESFDDQTFSCSENSKSRRRHQHYHTKRSRSEKDDDDDEDDEMYYSTDNKFSESHSKKKRRQSSHRSDNGHLPELSEMSSGGGSNKKTPSSAARPGRPTSSEMNCFLCRYGNREFDAVSKEDMRKLLAEIERGIGHTSPAALAKTIHLQYMETIFTDGRGSGTQMPVWRTRSVLEHLLFHDNDPRITLWLNIIDCRRTIDCLSAVPFVRDPATGQIVPTKNCELKMKHEAHLWNLYKTPIDKMNFFSPTAQIDLSKNNKRVDGVFEKRGPRHFAHTRISGLDTN